MKKKEKSIPSIVFPEILTEDSYEYRKILIHVKRNNLKIDNFDDISKTISHKYDKIKESLLKTTKSYDDGFSKTSLENAHANQKDIQNKFDDDVSTIFTIALPLPNELSDRQSHQWGEATGIAKELSAGATKVVDTIFSDKNKVGKLAGKVPKVDVISGLVSKAADSVSMRKPLVDPSYYQNYTGSTMRDFTFSFDLIPNNPNDSQNILNIILALKKFSSPSTVVSSAVILSPHFFDIEFSNPYLDTMTNLYGLVIKNIEVQYGASGQMAYIGSDGMLKHTRLTLTFGERRMMTSEMWG